MAKQSEQTANVEALLRVFDKEQRRLEALGLPSTAAPTPERAAIIARADWLIKWLANAMRILADPKATEADCTVAARLVEQMGKPLSRGKAWRARAEMDLVLAVQRAADKPGNGRQHLRDFEQAWPKVRVDEQRFAVAVQAWRRRQDDKSPPTWRCLVELTASADLTDKIGRDFPLRLEGLTQAGRTTAADQRRHIKAGINLHDRWRKYKGPLRAYLMGGTAIPAAD